MTYGQNNFKYLINANGGLYVPEGELDIGIVTVTSTGTQINLLNIATGRTGTGNLVFSASPTLTGTVVLPSATSIGDVSSTEIGYVDNVTSNIQTQLNARGRVATITTNILAGEETDVTLTGVTAEPYSLYIIDADGLNITDAVKDSTAISGGVYHTYIYSVDAKTNAKIRVLW